MSMTYVSHLTIDNDNNKGRQLGLAPGYCCTTIVYYNNNNNNKGELALT